MRVVLIFWGLILFSACKVAKIQFPAPIEEVKFGMEFKTLMQQRPALTIVESLVETPYREFMERVEAAGIREIHFFVDKQDYNLPLVRLKFWFDDLPTAADLCKTYFGRPKSKPKTWTAKTNDGKIVYLELSKNTLVVSSQALDNKESPVE